MSTLVNRFTSMTFLTPSGTDISGSAVQTVPRIRFGFSGCISSFRSLLTKLFPTKVFKLEIRNLVGVYTGGAFTTGFSSPYYIQNKLYILKYSSKISPYIDRYLITMIKFVLLWASLLSLILTTPVVLVDQNM